MSEYTGPSKLKILLIDDDPHIRKTLREYLESRGYRLFAAAAGKEGLALLEREAIDVVITDVRMPGMDGFAVLRRIRSLAPETEVIVMTGYGNIDSAVQALREGAFDFFTKPIKMRELSASLERTARFHALRREKERYKQRLEHLSSEAQRHFGLGAIIGRSPPMAALKERVGLLCNAEATTVLIQGETGTGKELVARAIHYGGARAKAPFVAVDCTAIPAALIESELYGHVKGAFTDAREGRRGYFELADGGTIFLDEIGDMAPTMQAKLLRTLDQRRIHRVGGSREISVDVRVISATNRNLEREIAQGNFRADLYYRLNTMVVEVPPLRERAGDIALLARHFLAEYARELRKEIEGFTPEAMARLERYAFPGNVRELRNMVERAAILCSTPCIAPQDLQLKSGRPVHRPAPGAPGGEEGGFTLEAAASLELAGLEREAIRVALQRAAGNQARAARLLGISRMALRRRLQRHAGEQSAGGEASGREEKRLSGPGPGE